MILLIIFLIILYFFIGYIVTKLFDEYDIMGSLLDDEFFFFVIIIFFPPVLIGIGIKVFGTKIVDVILKLLKKD